MTALGSPTARPEPARGHEQQPGKRTKKTKKQRKKTLAGRLGDVFEEIIDL